MGTFLSAVVVGGTLTMPRNKWFFKAQYIVVLIVIEVFYDQTSVACTCSRVVYYFYCIVCYPTFSGFKGAYLTRKKVPKSTSNVAHLPSSSPFHHAHFFLHPSASSALQTRKLNLKSGHRTHSQRRPDPILKSLVPVNRRLFSEVINY